MNTEQRGSDMGKKKQDLLVIPRPLGKLFREIKSVSLEELDAYGQCLSPVHEYDYVIGRIDSFSQKILVLQCTKTDSVEKGTEENDMLAVNQLLNEIQILSDLLRFFINTIPLPEELWERKLKRFVRKNFIFVCQEDLESNGHGDAMDIEVELEEMPEPITDDEDEEDLHDRPPINKKPN